MRSNKKFIDEVHSVYRGHSFIVRLQRRGHRCGYVQVNSDEFFEKIQQGYLDISLNTFDFRVHGGITFVDSCLKNNFYLPPGRWIGFDCMHHGDLPDVTAAIEWFELSERELGIMLDDIKTLNIDKKLYVRNFDYVYEECRNLVDQLMKYGDIEWYKK